jgi:Domain of unknown function (DUF4296)
MKNIFFLIVAGLFASCLEKNNVPSAIIQPDEMQKILWDVIRAQALSSEMARKDSSVNEIAETKVLTERVFEIHKTTSNEFNQSYTWYTNHPDIIKIIFDSLNNQNQRESQLEMKEKMTPQKQNPLKRLDSLKKANFSKRADSLKKFE